VLITLSWLVVEAEVLTEVAVVVLVVFELEQG
jgi:hypothetical protein